MLGAGAGALSSALRFCSGVVEGLDLAMSPGGAQDEGLLNDIGCCKLDKGHLTTASRHSSSCA